MPAQLHSQRAGSSPCKTFLQVSPTFGQPILQHQGDLFVASRSMHTLSVAVYAGKPELLVTY
jgi:hypothetical protein